MSSSVEQNNNSAAQQFNGREGETATLLSSCVVYFGLSVAVSPHVTSTVHSIVAEISLDAVSLVQICGVSMTSSTFFFSRAISKTSSTVSTV